MTRNLDSEALRKTQVSFQDGQDLGEADLGSCWTCRDVTEVELLLNVFIRRHKMLNTVICHHNSLKKATKVLHSFRVHVTQCPDVIKPAIGSTHARALLSTVDTMPCQRNIIFKVL